MDQRMGVIVQTVVPVAVIHNLSNAPKPVSRLAQFSDISLIKDLKIKMPDTVPCPAYFFAAKDDTLYEYSGASESKNMFNHLPHRSIVRQHSY